MKLSTLLNAGFWLLHITGMMMILALCETGPEKAWAVASVFVVDIATVLKCCAIDAKETE